MLQIAFAMITVILAFAQCTPTKKLWEKNIPGTCWSPNVLNRFSYWFCAYTTLTDFVLAIVPVAAFWKLQMKRSTKIGLCILMSMTMLSAIVTIIKGSYLHLSTDTADPCKYTSSYKMSAGDADYRSVQPSTSRTLGPVSQLYSHTIKYILIFSRVEQNIVIMAACVPTMRPLFHRTWDRTTGRHDYSISQSANAAATKSKARDQRSRQSALSVKDSGVPLADIDPKEYAESAESQQGIMRTMEISVQRESNDERPLSLFKDVVPQSLRESQR
jgi:hypothetical protein